MDNSALKSSMKTRSGMVLFSHNFITRGIISAISVFAVLRSEQMRRRGGEGLLVSVSVSECVFVCRKKEVENRKTALEIEKELKTRTNT
jgi:hypothetical protein